MDCDEEDNSGVAPAPGDEESGSAVNSIILDYYKKIGRKRDLEQYFSLSTAQSDIRDPSSLFWSRMKAETESSDSGERSDKKSESSQELCRISIRFPAQDACTSQIEGSRTKTESVSPPIIIEEVSPDSRHNSDDEAMKSDDNNSQKSYDVLLDTSMNKHHSPSSSITSQRKLEWDSLADVGYANESDRKTSASSLSTLERLALKQQYSNNDTQHSNLEAPTAHSTPLDENETKSKSKKGVGKKSTKLYKKDVEFLEVNVPHSSHINPSQSINVNLTKHISFNVEKDGKVTLENVQKNINVSPEKVSVERKISPVLGMDKEIQTSLTKPKESNVSENVQVQLQPQRIPILISLNTLRSRVRRKKLRMARRKIKNKKRANKEYIPVQEKSGEQLSEAESFEYMPGHIYNQNQMTANERPANAADNKSSLESSGVLTTDSSKGSNHSFAKDLEKSIDLLKAALQQRGDDSNLRKELIKQVCHRLLKSRYRDDDSTTDFLSGLSFSSKKLGIGDKNNTTTSTSDANNSAESTKRPKKSILRTDKFNSGPVASTSQSVPNLPIASNSEKQVASKLSKRLTTSNTDSDMSSKEKTSSDNVFAKTSSEELYQKYLQAKKKEEAYKRHLKDKEMFLKQKLVSSDSAFKVPLRVQAKPSSSGSNRLKDLMHDLTRNNYDDGSGDASKLEGPGSSQGFDRFLPNRNQRSHSVFTLSSGNSDNKKPNLKKRLHCDIKDLSKPGSSKDNHYCCCPHHAGNMKLGFTDGSVQVNMKKPCGDVSCPARPNKPVNMTSKQEQKAESPRNSARVISDDVTGDVKYVCLCSNKVIQEVPDSFLIYKCSRLTNRGIQLEETSPRATNEVFIPCNNQTCDKRNTVKAAKDIYIPCNNTTCQKRNLENIQSTSAGLSNKSSQTNMLIKMLSSDQSFSHSDDKKCTKKGIDVINIDDVTSSRRVNSIYEATRCIQTEISINPKISEPTLSDINIVSDTDCAKLVSEQYKKLKKPSLTEVFNARQGKGSDSVNDPVSSSKSTGTSKDVDIELEDDDFYERTSKGIKDNTDNQRMNIDHSEKFTIPIQGTNMTLMVSIGSERKVSVTKKPEETVTQGIWTDKTSVIEQAPCLTEEYTKEMQSDKFAQVSTIDHNSNNIGNDCQNGHTLTEATKTPLMVNTYLTTDEPKYGTYPKKSPINERKPFRRSNTDTERVEGVQTGTLGIKKFGAMENVPMEIQTRNKCSCGCNGTIDKCKTNCKERTFTPRDNNKLSFVTTSCEIPNINSTMCSCGCGGLLVNCKQECVERKSLPKEPLRKQSLEKEKCSQVDDQVCGQKDSVDKCSEKCPCGCGGNKENCKECNKPKLTPRGQCTKHLNKEISTESYHVDEDCTKCPCGCGGRKDKCKKNCKEVEPSPNENCSKQENKQISPEQKNLCGNSQECPCGCGGTKDNCREDCNKLISPRVQFEKQLDKQTSTEKDFPDKQSQNCSCGCGGIKDKCRKICKELKASPRGLCRKQLDKQISTENDFTSDQNQTCPCGCGGSKDNCKDNCSERTLTSKEIGTQKNVKDNESPRSSGECQKYEESKCILRSIGEDRRFENQLKIVDSRGEQTDIRSSDKSQKSSSETGQTDTVPDPILELIQNITKKYSKKEMEKSKRKKCFKEIMTVLNYLLETDESTDQNDNRRNPCESTSTADESDPNVRKKTEYPCNISSKKLPEKVTKEISKKFVDKGVQLSGEYSKSRTCITESSELPTSTDIPGTSSDSATCKVLNKIKKECERYHQKRCKVHGAGKKADGTSSTSANCDQCRRVHHCSCRSHKCKGNKKCEKIQKGPVAYNLILQTSESMVSEEPVRDKNRQLKNIIVKVPKKKPDTCIPFKEMAAKFERNMPCTAPKDVRSCRSRSLPNESEISSMEEIIRRSQGATVREYLEKNRPDFIEKCSQRQSCLKYISDSRCDDPCGPPSLKMVVVHTPNCSGSCNTYRGGIPTLPMTCMSNQRLEPRMSIRTGLAKIANDRAVQRDLLSLYLAQLPDVTKLDKDELRRLAKDLGRHMRHKQPASKFISEREMKKHSEKIYKSLPEVVQKKEEIKKENIKKTNLLMANMFKKNLQKKTLRGSVNLSNYSTVIKI